MIPKTSIVHYRRTSATRDPTLIGELTVASGDLTVHGCHVHLRPSDAGRGVLFIALPAGVSWRTRQQAEAFRQSVRAALLLDHKADLMIGWQRAAREASGCLAPIGKVPRR